MTIYFTFTTLSNCLNKVKILGKIQGKFGKTLLGNIQEKHLGETFRKTFTKTMGDIIECVIIYKILHHLWEKQDIISCSVHLWMREWFLLVFTYM